MIGAISIALSGLTAAAKRADAAASNIANVQSTGAIGGGGPAPYTPVDVKQTAQSPGQGGGVRAEYAPRNPGFVPAYDPSSPFADANGIIGVPNVDLATEAVNLKIAELAYKASAKTLSVSEDMANALFKALDRK